MGDDMVDRCVDMIYEHLQNEKETTRNCPSGKILSDI